MSAYGSAVAPERLVTTGLGPCIGVAVICAYRGFVMHSPDIFVEYDTVTDPFFELLDTHIPRRSRPGVVPVIACGCLDVYTGTPQDEEIHECTRKCRGEIVRRLLAAGFANPNVRWAAPNESASLLLITERQIIIRETLNIRSPESRPTTESFQC